MEQQLVDLAVAMATIQKQNSAIQASVGSLEEIKPMVVELASWKPAVDQAMTELRDDLGDLRQQVERLSHNPVLVVKPSELPSESAVHIFRCAEVVCLIGT